MHYIYAKNSCKNQVKCFTFIVVIGTIAMYLSMHSLGEKKMQSMTL